MKIKFSMDRSTGSSSKFNAIQKIIQDLGSKATISGDVITVDSYDELKVATILKNNSVNYSRSS